MKPTIKLEGDKLVAEASLAAGIDTNKDGQFAASVSGVIKIEVDGSEVLEELMKSSKLALKAKELLGQ